jgi:hypothetical protein
MAALAMALQRGRLSGALGVVGGGALMAFSYRTIRGSVDAIVGRIAPAAAPADAPRRAPSLVWPVTKLVLRYAVLGLAAWLLLVRLRAHPIGLMAGVTAPVLAVAVEAFRLQRR